MKKFVKGILCAAMIISLAACSTNNVEEEKPVLSFTAGTYTATAKGMKGDVTVEVEVSENEILSAKVTSQQETYGIGYGLETTPVEAIPAKVVETQGLGIDNITGATITTYAVKTAITDCLTQAGGDITLLESITENVAVLPTEYETEVVIIGAGAAGLSAGITALDEGAKVLVLEKQDITGGATARSGGKVMAAGTDIQKAAGIEDNAQMMFDYLKEIGGDYLNDEMVKEFCDNSLENYNWLADLGVKFQDVEPIHSSLPTWRVHNTLTGGGMTNGIGGQITVPLENQYTKNGGSIEYGVTVDSIVMNEAGEAVGVTGTRADGSKVTVNAKSVIIATGGYAQNREMMAMYDEHSGGYYTSVPTGNVGDGITMAEAVGADIYLNPNVQTVYTSFTCGVGINEEAGLIVTNKGERVVNEYTYQYHVAQAIQDAKSTTAYYIATSNDPNGTVQYGMMLDSTPRASSIEELAGLINMDPAVLSATVTRYNELCAKGVDEDFGKPADKMIPVQGETYYAILMNPAVTVTYSGIVTDSEAHVLDEEGNVIKGLYAAGETAFPGLFGTEYPGCGAAIGYAVYFGRAAGENAANGQ